MAGKDIIMANQRELKLLHIVQKVIERSVGQAEAAEMLALSDRQVRRLVRRVRGEGASGVMHRSRGRQVQAKDVAGGATGGFTTMKGAVYQEVRSAAEPLYGQSHDLRGSGEVHP